MNVELLEQEGVVIRRNYKDSGKKKAAMVQKKSFSDVREEEVKSFLSKGKKKFIQIQS